MNVFLVMVIFLTLVLLILNGSKQQQEADWLGWDAALPCQRGSIVQAVAAPYEDEAKKFLSVRSSVTRWRSTHVLGVVCQERRRDRPRTIRVCRRVGAPRTRAWTSPLRGERSTTTKRHSLRHLRTCLFLFRTVAFVCACTDWFHRGRMRPPPKDGELSGWAAARAWNSEPPCALTGYGRAARTQQRGGRQGGRATTGARNSAANTIELWGCGRITPTSTRNRAIHWNLAGGSEQSFVPRR